MAARLPTRHTVNSVCLYMCAYTFLYVRVLVIVGTTSVFSFVALCCSVTQSCLTLPPSWTAAHQASLPFTISQSLLKLMSIKLVMTYSHLVLCYPLLLLPSIFPSMRVFSNELALHQVAKDRSFSISPSNEYSGLISFTIDWFNLLAVQGALKSL